VGNGGRILVAGMAAILCVDACPGQPAHIAARQSDGTDLARRLRDWQEADRRICAIDRLSESRLPRTTCRTVQEWRERQHRGLSRQ
jgi:hypothetical protein